MQLLTGNQLFTLDRWFILWGNNFYMELLQRNSVKHLCPYSVVSET